MEHRVNARSIANNSRTTIKIFNKATAGIAISKL